MHPGGEPSKITCASHTNSLSPLAGKEVALKVAMADAELYSISLGCPDDANEALTGMVVV